MFQALIDTPSSEPKLNYGSGTRTWPSSLRVWIGLFTTLGPGRYRRQFAGDISYSFPCMIIAVIWLKIHSNLPPSVWLTLALVQIMAWCLSGNKPLSEAMMSDWCTLNSFCLSDTKIATREFGYHCSGNGLSVEHKGHNRVKYEFSNCNCCLENCDSFVPTSVD